MFPLHPPSCPLIPNHSIFPDFGRCIFRHLLATIQENYRWINQVKNEAAPTNSALLIFNLIIPANRDWNRARTYPGFSRSRQQNLNTRCCCKRAGNEPFGCCLAWKQCKQFSCHIKKPLFPKTTANRRGLAPTLHLARSVPNSTATSPSGMQRHSGGQRLRTPSVV